MLDLEAIELIKQLKARYYRGVDVGGLELLESIFTDDMQIDIFINLETHGYLTGSAIYEDTCVKRDGRWLISKTGYNRLLEMIEPLGDRKITSRTIN